MTVDCIPEEGINDTLTPILTFIQHVIWFMAFLCAVKRFFFFLIVIKSRFIVFKMTAQTIQTQQKGKKL